MKNNKIAFEQHINELLNTVMNDEGYNEETRMLVKQVVNSSCPIEAKIALIESCMEAKGVEEE